ncbi:hypothetical protein D3C76_1596070 [compost metagenome]
MLQGDAHAQQRHADAQHGAGGELDAGLAGTVIGKKIQGHAQQQGKQHDRRTVVLGQERRGGRDNQTDDKPRCQFARATVDTGKSNGAHGADSSVTMTINAWPSMISTG